MKCSLKLKYPLPIHVITTVLEYFYLKKNFAAKLVISI
jgi:hypothetical protein